MLKFIKTNPLKVISVLVLFILSLMNMYPQKAHGSQATYKANTANIPATVTMTPSGNKKPTTVIVAPSKRSIHLPLLIPLLCEDKQGRKNVCERKK